MNSVLDKLKELEAKYLYMILAGIIAVMVLFDFFLIMRLQIGLLGSLDTKIVQINKNIIDLTTNNQRLTQYNAQLDKARSLRKRFEAMVYKRDQVPGVLNRVSNIANDLGVKIDQLVPQQLSAKPLVQNEDGKYYTMAIALRLRSGYHQLGKFINRMEQESLFWQIEQMKIVENSKDMQRQDINMDINILILEK